MVGKCKEGRKGFSATEREDNKLGVRPADRFYSLGVTDSSGGKKGVGGGNSDGWRSDPVLITLLKGLQIFFSTVALD